jgi:flagellar biosynthetic protein FlhB
MSGEKSEKPTAHRIDKARQNGQVAKSQDLNSAIMLGTATMLIMGMGAYMVSLLSALMRQLFSYAHNGTVLQPDTFGQLMADVFVQLLLILAPFLGSLMVVGAVANLIQVGPLFTTKPLTPSMDKLNPLNGFKRIFSMRSAVEAGKGLFKVAVVGSIGYAVIAGHQQDFLTLAGKGPVEGVAMVMGWLTQLMFWSALAYLAMGLTDWRYQAFEHEKRLRMSKQDIKDENKTMEGSPQMKAQIRRFGQKFLTKQQLKDIATADVVVTNPTHFAIALRYDPDIAPAPHVVAKGVDQLALKIKELAAEYKVEMVENRPLARSLYDQVDAGHMIPPELFAAVAEVLAFVYRKRKGRGFKKPKPTPKET